MQTDVFRPREDPARRIYDAFQDEARKRSSREVEEWQHAELLRVWREAMDYSREKGISILSIDAIKGCEVTARGHCDYGAKWAYAIARLLSAA